MHEQNNVKVKETGKARIFIEEGVVSGLEQARLGPVPARYVRQSKMCPLLQN